MFKLFDHFPSMPEPHPVSNMPPLTLLFHILQSCSAHPKMHSSLLKNSVFLENLTCCASQEHVLEHTIIIGLCCEDEQVKSHFSQVFYILPNS